MLGDTMEIPKDLEGLISEDEFRVDEVRRARERDLRMRESSLLFDKDPVIFGDTSEYYAFLKEINHPDYNLRPFDPPKRSNVRERALQKSLDRLERHSVDALRMLDVRRPGLSPAEARSNVLYVQQFQGARKRLRDELEFVKRQDAAATAMDEALKKLTPLQRARRIRGPLRYAAIAGIIQRDPNFIAKAVSRDVNARVKARAAARRRMDESRRLRSNLWYSPFVFGSKHVMEERLGFGFVGDVKHAFDPCHARQVRREVMHAHKQNKGHHSKKRRSMFSMLPC